MVFVSSGERSRIAKKKKKLLKLNHEQLTHRVMMNKSIALFIVYGNKVHATLLYRGSSSVERSQIVKAARTRR